jgi:hypothetical protein
MRPSPPRARRSHTRPAPPRTGKRQSPSTRRPNGAKGVRRSPPGGTTRVAEAGVGPCRGNSWRNSCNPARWEVMNSSGRKGWPTGNGRGRFPDLWLSPQEPPPLPSHVQPAAHSVGASGSSSPTASPASSQFVADTPIGWSRAGLLDGSRNFFPIMGTLIVAWLIAAAAGTIPIVGPLAETPRGGKRQSTRKNRKAA